MEACSTSRSPFRRSKTKAAKVIGASKIARDITDRIQNERRRTAQYAVANLLAGSWSLAEAGPRIIESIAAIGNWVAGSIWLEDEAEERVCIAPSPGTRPGPSWKRLRK